MNFKQYITEEENHITDEMVRNTVIRKADKEETLDDVIEKANPTVWTARVVDGRKYVVYLGKVLDITSLMEEIRELYERNGYSDYGFAKLDESELIRYTKVKDILMRSFRDSITDTLDAKAMAELLFKNEVKEFDWKPEEY